MYKSVLDDSKGSSCSIWINLMEYALPETDTLDVLGLTGEQLAFAKTLVPNEMYPDIYTTLFYAYCSIRVPRYIPRTLAKAVSSGYAFRPIDIRIEDAFDLPQSPDFDTRAFRPLRPVAVVASWPNNLPTGERVIVHRNLTAGTHLVQYRIRGDASYPLLRRLASLQRYSDAILVTNAPMREVLGIRH